MPAYGDNTTFRLELAAPRTGGTCVAVKGTTSAYAGRRASR